IPAYLERTKRGAWHVDLFAAEPIAASLMRGALRFLLADCGFPMPAHGNKTGPAGTIEMFPAQDSIGAGFGNFVFVPYFALGKDGRTAFVRSDQPEFPAVALAEFVAELQLTPVSRLTVLAERDVERSGQQQQDEPKAQ